MIFDISKARIFLRPGTTDLRKAANGLSVIIQRQRILVLQQGTQTVESNLLGQIRL